MVTAAYSVHRFLELRGASVCRDQFLRLTMVNFFWFRPFFLVPPRAKVRLPCAVLLPQREASVPICERPLMRCCPRQAALCVNAKYWDEGAAMACQNSRIAGRAGIALEDFNRMEINFMRGLEWTLAMSEGLFEEWAAKLEALGEEATTEQEARRELERCNQSPLLSTDVAEQLSASYLSVASSPSCVSFATPCTVAGAAWKHASSGEGETEMVMRVSSSTLDSKGDAITARLVFPELQQGLDAGNSASFLRVGSESVSRTDTSVGTTILRCFSYADST